MPPNPLSDDRDSSKFDLGDVNNTKIEVIFERFRNLFWRAGEHLESLEETTDRLEKSVKQNEDRSRSALALAERTKTKLDKIEARFKENWGWIVPFISQTAIATIVSFLIAKMLE
ncbi:MAG: hypothetical protein J7647_27525 [Cyanobacteria bacterium SBLK]|nr:hypothetical protein [Cyanobacteria bacterium SBLK]